MGPQGPEGPPGADMSAEVSALTAEHIIQNERLDLAFERIVETRHDLDVALNRIIPCGEYKLFGCTQATSANGSIFSLDYDSTLNVLFMFDENNFGDSLFVAIPVSEFDYSNLWVGGTSNLTRPHSPEFGQVLVDDCDNPTVELVLAGQPPSSRLVTNNGNFYRAALDPSGNSEFGYGPILQTIDGVIEWLNKPTVRTH